MMAEEEIKKETQEEEVNPEDLMKMWEEALKESTQAQTEGEEKSGQSEAKKEVIETKPTPSSQPMTFKELSPARGGEAPQELDFILDLPLEVSVEIGRTKMLIKDLLKLTQGSIIELDRLAGEAVDIYVNGKLMAKGEVVVVNDRFGVRVTEIISAQDRVKKLGS
jgi:flagellar motor switch protein FliN/FliY